MMTKLSLVLALICIGLVAALTVTAAPTWSGDSIGGTLLLFHMAAGGALVVALPVYALVGAATGSPKTAAVTESGQRLRSVSFWCLLALGWVTIGTVFVCMLPIPSTDQMHQLILWHAVAGYGMTIAAIGLLVGWMLSGKASR